ncbi:MAG TPA: peptide chain release factor 2 [Spirochaetales bacterium]|nr:peptide chain release factor 2 [Spirochaetales bacterium]HPB65641.1 peptide chain release factor 2 [Spirochaetales bacterium]HPG87434.1 peptide chain release factor 2 [Spirochaetales bacterium]HPM73660.1 peptide chain release factor 2 [Spirochaetales bacterium]HQO66237.1 peptide chain release factor 2 [Spirochaetales bacterium]
MLEDYMAPIAQLKKEVLEIWGRLDAATIRSKIETKESQSSEPGFWNDQKRSERIMGELKVLRNRLETWEEIKRSTDALDEIYAMAIEEGEGSLEGEIASSLAGVRDRFDKAVTLELMTGEADRTGVFLSIHAGSGGTEACDWAGMLMRMYTRWAERRGFKYEIVDMLEAEGGIKSVTMEIDGAYAYGHLRGESGVHRLVRISPFDANARRHTSFASVSAFPVIDDSIDVTVKPDEIRIDTYRAGGAGGQKVNKTDSAVRITHLATGIVVTCQNERSQHKNKDVAMQVLKSRLYDLYRKEKDKENEKYVGDKKEIAWGSQIRSYVFQPYTMVKDHRTKFFVGNIHGVMDGDLDPFIDSYLHFLWKGGTVQADGDDDDEV